jgi:hypothetical protein
MKTDTQVKFTRKHPALFSVPQTASKIVCFMSWEKNAPTNYGPAQYLQNNLEPVLPQNRGRTDDSLERF